MWWLVFVLSCVSCSSDSVENRILQLRTGPQRSDTPPSYMIHLYNRYRKGRMPYSAANTVRSFFSTPGRLGVEDLLVFNLTGVHPTEYVERVDLHLGRLSKKPFSAQVDVLDLSRPLRPKVDTIPLARAQGGILDITDSIIACLEGEAEQHQLIGVSVRGADDVFSQPFLVLFSEDDDHLSIEELGKERRKKRELMDNELPDLKGDKSLAEVQARIKYKSLDSNPKPEARKHRKRRRRKEKRLPYAWGKSWFKKSDLKDYEGDLEEDYPDDEQDPEEEVCQKKRLVVSFSELGWADWVISPKSFDAAYCAGTCLHPLKKRTQSSNHATIQSLVESLGLKKGVPGLCCVPQSLSPVSLLYYDHNRNIVLKSFPGMSVDACSCR